MKETLSKLVEVQQIDEANRDLAEARVELETLTGENRSNLEVFDKMLTELEGHLGESQTFVSQKQEEIREAEGAISRSRARLPVITNQRELMALNKEIEVARRSIKQRTDELARLKTEMETAVADFEKKTRERKALAAEMRKLEAALRRRIAEREATTGTLAARRAVLEKAIPRPLYSRYKRIAAAREGRGLVVLLDETCVACHMQVPPQVFIRLQRMESIEYCQTCNRILVYYLVDGDPENED